MEACFLASHRHEESYPQARWVCSRYGAVVEKLRDTLLCANLSRMSVMSNHCTKWLHFSDGLREGSNCLICCRKFLITSCKSFVLIGWISFSDSDPSSSIETSPIWWLLFSMPSDSGNTKAVGCSETSPVWLLLFSIPSDSSKTKAARGCSLTCRICWFHQSFISCHFLCLALHMPKISRILPEFVLKTHSYATWNFNSFAPTTWFKKNNSCFRSCSDSSDQRVLLQKGHLSTPRSVVLPWPHPHRKSLWIAPHAKWQHAAEKLRCALEAFRSASHSAFVLVGAFLEHKASVCNSSHTCALSRQLVHGIACFCQGPWPKDQFFGYKRGTLMDYGASSGEKTASKKEVRSKIH